MEKASSGRKRPRETKAANDGGSGSRKETNMGDSLLTRNGISILLTGESFPETPVILKVFPGKESSHCVLTDMKDSVVAMVLVEGSFDQGKIYFVEVTGFVVSEANVGTSNPLLFLTAWNVLRVEEQRRKSTKPAANLFLAKDGRNQGGRVSQFLDQWMPLIPNTDLVGTNTLSEQSSILRNAQGQLVADFLARHAAVQTLHNDPAHVDTDETTQRYFAVLQEFQTSQMDRQSASLTSNAGRQDAARASLVKTQYSKALETALLQDAVADRLSTETLCRWHGQVCGQGIHPEAGCLRQKNVRAGNTSFGPYREVKSDLDSVCSALTVLEQRLLHQKRPVGITTGIAAAVYAAVALFGVVDTHPWADGNGRTARIVTSWALCKAGLPFCVQLFATPTQRKEYIEAIRQTHRTIGLVARGKVNADQHLAALQSAGAFSPLVDLILDRITKAITEFQKLLQEKTSWVSEETEAKAARKYRERAAQGSCIICFDDKPNIATLCCGKAVHLNCIAEWLSANSSCPQCRGDLPSLPPRMRVRPRPAAENQHNIRAILAGVNGLHAALRDMEAYSAGDDTSEVSDDWGTTGRGGDTSEDHGTNVQGGGGADHDGGGGGENPDETTTEDTTSLEEFTLTGTEIESLHAAAEDATTEFDVQEYDTATQEEEEDLVQAGTAAADDGDDSEQDSTTDLVASQETSFSTSSSTMGAAVENVRPELPPFCYYCRNRSAQDCSNACCGRCCVLNGQVTCERHNC